MFCFTGNVNQKVLVSQQFQNGDGAVDRILSSLSILPRVPLAFSAHFPVKFMAGSAPKRILIKRQVPLTMKRRLWYWDLNNETEKISNMKTEEPSVCRK